MLLNDRMLVDAISPSPGDGLDMGRPSGFVGTQKNHGGFYIHRILRFQLDQISLKR